MKYFSMFSGIGGFELGIQRTNIHRSIRQAKIEESTPSIESMETCEQNMGELGNNACDNNGQKTICIGYSEIDKYAIQIYKKHFKEHKNYGDARRIVWESVPDFDMLCGGFPCQSFSIAGKRGGFEDTRGTLFYEIAKCVRIKRPKLLFLENVKGLLSHDNGRTFGTILATLSDLGYILEWQVLNSKDYGVPQNRERVFIIGHLGEGCERQVFPIGEENEKSCIEIGTITAIEGNDILKRCYSTEGISPVLNTCGGGNVEGKFLMKNAKIRRLTPTECERLQSFPDGWTEGISDTQRYKCLGNAVTVNVIETIVKRLRQEYLPL